MASIKDLKKRIGTVKNTQQTTKAMKMVSAAKLRRAQEAIQGQRPYARGVEELIRTIAGLPQAQGFSKLIISDEEVTSKKLLLVVVTSDRGLCGGFNSNAIRIAHRWVAQNQSKYEKIDLSFVGKKAGDFFKNKSYTFGPVFSDFAGKVSILKAKGLAKQLVALYESGEYQEIKIAYNEFKNAVTQHPTVEDYLPIDRNQLLAKGTDSSGDNAVVLLKPNAGVLMSELLNKHVVVHAHRIMLESQAGEHGARMSAMENATKNAGEMIKKLTLQYNKQRQAGITKELLEIISGSESQKNQ